jgi:CRP-like cAMP-binding protein
MRQRSRLWRADLSKPEEQTLYPLLRKLRCWRPLDAADAAAVLALPYVERSVDAGQVIVWDGDRPQHCCAMLSGFAFRHKIAAKGARQILSVHMRGDLVDIHNAMLGVADHNVQMLTDGEIAMIPLEAVIDLAAERPLVAAALWHETLVDGSIFREWIVNVGRRDARTRLAHLLCELALRQEQAGLADRLEYRMPMTQEQLADATGLTSVHVNRMLMGLRSDGLISRSNRHVSVTDWDALAQAGDFNPHYLHIGDQAGAATAA